MMLEYRQASRSPPLACLRGAAASAPRLLRFRSVVAQSAQLMSGGEEPRLLYVEHVPAEQGPALYAAAVAAGCGGIISKRAESRYWSGDTREWLKIKLAEVRERQAEAVRAAHAKRSKT
jgi:ATP-dependent DNA ligase